MSKALYDVVGGTAHKTKKVYGVLDGVTRKIKKSYDVVGGKTKQFFSAEAFGSYSGNYTSKNVTVDGVARTLYTLTSSGTLVLNNDAEYWMCAGGKKGSSSKLMIPGMGGNGGNFISGTVSAGEHAITVAASGGASVLGTVATTANGTKGSGGGGVGKHNGQSGTIKDNITSGAGATGGGVSTIPFGVSSLYKHCAGGSGGSGSITSGTQWVCKLNGGNGGSNGSNGSAGSYVLTDSGLTTGNVKNYCVGAPGTGGTKGGGVGGQCEFTYTSIGGGNWYVIGATGSDATFYGSGGGGAACGSKTGDDYTVFSGGAGYQGVVYILD